MDKNQDYAGQPFFAVSDTEAIKARATAFEEVEHVISSFNPEDPNSFIAVINESSVTMLASNETLPRLAYSLTRTLVSLQAMVMDSEQSVKLAVAHALARAMEDSNLSIEEESDNEKQDTSNVSN